MSSGGGGVIPVANVGHEEQEGELHQAPTSAADRSLLLDSSASSQLKRVSHRRIYHVIYFPIVVTYSIGPLLE